MSRLHAFLLLVLASLAQTPPAAANSPVCDQTYCNCSRATHPDWVVVHCVPPPDKKMHIHQGDLPRNTTDLVITGAESVLFDTNSLSDLKDARFIRISGPKVILIKKYAAVNLNVVSLYLNIENCDVLDIEEQTFTNIKGPLSLAIHNCDTVSIDGETFSWLLTADIADVRQLQLGRGSFTLESTANQALQGDHGPFMTIELKNLSIPVLPSQSFSSAARISMLGVTVDEVMPDAFSANTYNIVIAINCTFKVVHGEAFAQKSLVNNLFFEGCTIERLAMGALQSAVGHLNIKESNFKNIESAAVKITVATIKIANSTFMNTIEERGFELSSWNKFVMQGNSFDELAPNAIVAPGANIHELIFVENSIRAVNPNSLGFIGETQANAADSIVYKSNYFGHQCHCDVTAWIAEVLGAKSGEPFVSESFCTVNEFFARCFNVPDLNMEAEKFIAGVCSQESKIFCEPFKTKTEGQATEIKNPRFPEKDRSSEVLSERDKKVIGIVIVTALGCVVIVLFISLVKWMRRKGYCLAVKNLLVSSNSNCTAFCDRFCTCTRNSGLDNAESISRLSVHEYSERHRLNEPRIEIIQETTLPLPDMYTEEPVPSEDKTTQTLPEELTKELLESLKEKLDDPENYVEAREMIEHLYELIKVEESCNVNSPVPPHAAENIYELPFQNTVPRLGRNKKKMISVGTRTPSLDKLLPLSPYNRQTALAHEYFEPKDFAIHLYAEIENRDKKGMLNLMPDLVGEQAVPRGPYLRAVRDKVSAGSTSSSPSANSHSHISLSPAHTATIRSNNSMASNSSGKMINRPLPEKPIGCGETSSLRHG